MNVKVGGLFIRIGWMERKTESCRLSLFLRCKSVPKSMQVRFSPLEERRFIEFGMVEHRRYIFITYPRRRTLFVDRFCNKNGRSNRDSRTNQ